MLPGQLVSAEPELRLVELDPSLDRFVVLACDGIWDVLQAWQEAKKNERARLFTEIEREGEILFTCEIGG